ncbi:unnamed protein product, partial [Protopolystoma xenopodis]
GQQRDNETHDYQTRGTKLSQSNDGGKANGRVNHLRSCHADFLSSSPCQLHSYRTGLTSVISAQHIIFGQLVPLLFSSPIFAGHCSQGATKQNELDTSKEHTSPSSHFRPNDWCQLRFFQLSTTDAHRK